MKIAYSKEIINELRRREKILPDGVGPIMFFSLEESELVRLLDEIEFNVYPREFNLSIPKDLTIMNENGAVSAYSIKNEILPNFIDFKNSKLQLVNLIDDGDIILTYNNIKIKVE